MSLTDEMKQEDSKKREEKLLKALSRMQQRQTDHLTSVNQKIMEMHQKIEQTQEELLSKKQEQQGQRRIIPAISQGIPCLTCKSGFFRATEAPPPPGVEERRSVPRNYDFKCLVTWQEASFGFDENRRISSDGFMLCSSCTHYEQEEDLTTKVEVLKLVGINKKTAVSDSVVTAA